MATNHSMDTSGSGFTLDSTAVSRGSGLLGTKSKASSGEDGLMLMFDERHLNYTE